MSDRLEDSPKRTQGRSPPFPFVPLNRAIDRLRQFNEHSRGHPIRSEAAALAWKYNQKSSGGIQTLAALRGFGLITAGLNGDAGKVQVSRLGRRLLNSPPENVRRELLVEAALSPKIFKECWDRWGERRPPDSECLWMLREERGFLGDAAERFLSVYDATLDYANLTGPISVPEALDDTKEDISEAPGTFPQTPSSLPSVAIAHPRGIILMENERELATGPLSKGAKFRVIVSGPVGEKEIDRLIRSLALVKETLAEGPDPDNDLARRVTDEIEGPGSTN